MQRPMSLFSLLLIGCPAPAPVDDTGSDTAALEPFDETLAEQLQEALDQAREDYDAPGVAVSVQMPGVEPWIGVAGVANQDTDEALAPEHRFKIASVTKTFTAAVVLQLVDEGALSLDDRLGDHWSGLDWAAGVTIRQLLQHSSGIPEYGTANLYQLGMHEPWTAEELMALMQDWELDFEPGTEWGYANSNYVLLGLIIQEVSGESWDQHVTARLLEPYGLTSMEAPLDDPTWGGVVPGYWLDEDTTQDIHPTALGASGAMVADIRDLAAWGSLWLGGEAVSETMATERWVDALDLYDGALYCGLGAYSILGAPDEPDTQLFHNGALNGYSSWMAYRANGEVSLSVMTNSWPGVGMDTGQAQDVAFELWPVLGWED